MNPLIDQEHNKRRISLSQLKTRLAQQEESGKGAEIFVLSYEQKRLIGHPALNKIKRLSEDYVNAGFDIRIL